MKLSTKVFLAFMAGASVPAAQEQIEVSFPQIVENAENNASVAQIEIDINANLSI